MRKRKMDRTEGLVGQLIPWKYGLALNVLRAPTNTNRKAPLILHVHGGGWTGGSHLNVPPSYQTEIDEGFVVASVEYTLAPQMKGTDTIIQLAEAWNWVIANAKTLGIDAGMIFLAGESVGGYYALMMSGWQGRSPAGIVTYSAPTNLNGMTVFPSNVTPAVDWGAPNSGLRVWLDGQGVEDLDGLWSPITYWSGYDCPIFMAHGTRDNMVSFYQFEAMKNELLFSSSVDEKLLSVDTDIHGWRLGPAVDAERLAFLQRLTRS